MAGSRFARIDAPVTAGTRSIDAFLASVERQAFVMARVSTRDDDAALDIVQDTMLRMVERYGDRPDEERRPLFFRILNNRIMDHHRKRGLDSLFRWFGDDHGGEEAAPDAVDQLPHGADEPDAYLGNTHLATALRRALTRLPQRQQQAFLLRSWQGMSVAETAEAMEVSQGSVKTHLSRAMAALRTRLGEYVA